MYYQPKVRLNSGRISGLEALLRWQRPGHGMVPPNEFIPLLGLKLDVVAEGVESAAQMMYLRRHHCDYIQGFCFSAPLPVTQVEKILRDEQHLLLPVLIGEERST